MILVCAWCGKKLKTSRGGGKGGISYGICLPCAKTVLNDSPGLMQEYVDQIDGPVALVNGEGVVVTANPLACTLLKKELAQIEGAGCEEVFGCARPGEPEECGRISECSGCEIKRCVTHTHRTGKEVCGVPTHLGQHPPQAPDEPWWLISTSKFLDCVVLKISGTSGVKKMRMKVRKEENGTCQLCGAP